MREPKVVCLCGREVRLEVLGRQYQTTWTGRCECGRVWSLEEMSEIIAEIEGEERTADMLARLGIKVF